MLDESGAKDKPLLLAAFIVGGYLYFEYQSKTRARFETVLIYVDLQLRNSEDEISRYIVDDDVWDHS